MGIDTGEECTKESIGTVCLWLLRQKWIALASEATPVAQLGLAFHGGAWPSRGPRTKNCFVVGCNSDPASVLSRSRGCQHISWGPLDLARRPTFVRSRVATAW